MDRETEGSTEFAGKMQTSLFHMKCT